MGVDDVCGLGRLAQVACSPGCPAVEPDFGGARQEPSEEGLTRAAPSPGLRHASRGGDYLVASAAGGFQESGDLAIATIEGDQCARIEYQTHSGRAGALSLVVFQEPIGGLDFCLAKGAESALPGGDSLSEGLQPKAVSGGLSEPGRDALVGAPGRGPDRFPELEVE